jgi:vacuolar-type H+-ATPase subunit H
MQGLELIKNLAEIDRDFAEKVEETRRLAEHRIKRAEEESKRLLDDTEAQIGQMEKASRTRIAEESAELAEDARIRAVREKERLHSQAVPNLDKAVEFILSEVMP